MMRKILFRGKCYDDGAWIFGSLLDDDIIITKGAVEVDDDYINIVDEWSSVLPETVGQYTGLKDSTGKWIFEGDIVKEKCHNLIFVVVWSEESLCYFTKRIDGRKDYLCDVWDCDVVGNRWDNPELLEVQG